jgi:adenylate cyclase
MNRFYSIATGVLVSHDAVIDKLIGDEVMALFLRGMAGPGYREKAVAAGEALLRAAAREDPSVRLPLGVAVHAGPAFVGNVGSAAVVDFTALGDTVNTAARLQGEAQAGVLVVSEGIWESAGRPAGMEARTLSLRGREESVRVRVKTVA